MKRNTYNQQSHVSFQPQSIQPALNANQFTQPSPHSSSTTSNSSISQWLNKAGNWISNKVQAAQNFVNSQGNEIVTDDILPVLRKSELLKLTANSLSSQPLVGVIDSGFKSDQHGNQMVEAIRQVNPEATIWKGGGVGTGDWTESLVKFVDTAKVTGNSRAVANLSFDLTEVHPDSSVSTRSKLTVDEQAALAYAHDNNVLIVASSGNQGGQMSALGTASQQFDNVVTVGAATGHERAAYSSYGKGLDLVAEVGAGGTSMAAAKVTGTIANIWSANSGLSEHQVNQILASTATDLKTPGWDAETGVGLVNPQEAISLAKHTTPELQVFSGTQLIQQVRGSLGEATWENKDGAIASERVNWGLPGPIGDWARDRVSKTVRTVDNVKDRAVNTTRRTASKAIHKADNVKDRAVNTTRRTASKAIHKADNVKDRAVNTTRRTASKAIRKVDNVKDRAVATTKEAWKDTSEWAKRNRKTISEVGHTALDVAGMVPVVGSVADAANAGWYLAAGDYKNAALSATGMIPGLGEAAIASKLALKGGKLLKNSERAVQIGNKADKGLVKGGRAIEVATLPANVQGTGVEASEAYRQFSQGNYLHSGLALTQAALSAAGVRSSSRTVRSGTDEIANRATQRRNGERPRNLERSDRPQITHSEAPVRAARLATDTYPDRASQQGVAPRQTRKLNSSPDSTRQKPTSEISDRSSGTATSQKSIHPKVAPVGHDSKTRTGFLTYADKGFSAPSEKTIATSDSKHANDELWLAGHPEHTIRPGETLWDIAERAYGDGRKWTSIRKSDGTPYTASEARRLLPGTTVHLQGNESKKTTPPREIGSTRFPISHLSKPSDLNQPPTPENTGGTSKSELEASSRSSKGDTSTPGSTQPKKKAKQQSWLPKFSAPLFSADQPHSSNATPVRETALIGGSPSDPKKTERSSGVPGWDGTKPSDSSDKGTPSLSGGNQDPPNNTNPPLGSGGFSPEGNEIAKRITEAIGDIPSDVDNRYVPPLSDMIEAVQSAAKGRQIAIEKSSRRRTSAANETGQLEKNGYRDNPGLGAALLDEQSAVLMKKSGRDAKDKDGSASATHAERKLLDSMLKSESPIIALGVNKLMCRSHASKPNDSTGWCIDHFSLKAMSTGKTIVVAEVNPINGDKGTWAFFPGLPAIYLKNT